MDPQKHPSKNHVNFLTPQKHDFSKLGFGQKWPKWSFLHQNLCKPKIDKK
jgi:hypothetical protein